jgi:hypothetical protein
MSTDQGDAGAGGAEFVVRPDGTVVGDDGAAGALAAALPYTGRLARRTGEIVGVGDLRGMEALGRRRLTVGVTWTPAGEGTYRAAATPVEPRTVPAFLVVGAVDTATAVDHCLGRIAALDGVVWASVVTAGSRVVAAQGERRELHHLAEVGNRMLAILRSLEDQHASGFVRLRFEQGAVMAASLGRHALVARVSTAGVDDLIAMIDEVRAVLTDRDLTAVTSEADPDATVQEDEPQAVAPELASPPPLVGARFAGAGERPSRTPRRRLFRSR